MLAARTHALHPTPSQRERRRERREARRLPKHLRKEDPARRGFYLPGKRVECNSIYIERMCTKFLSTTPDPTPAALARGRADSQFVWNPRGQHWRDKQERRERERERLARGRAATPVARVGTPDLGCVARNDILLSSGLKVCVEEEPGGKVLAAGLLRVIGRDLVVVYQGECMSPFKFLKGCGYNATSEAVESKLVLLKSRAPVFAHLGFHVAPSLPPYTALASSEMASESVLAGMAVGLEGREGSRSRGHGYVAPALRTSSYVGTQGWNALQQAAAGNVGVGAEALGGEAESEAVPEEMGMEKAMGSKMADLAGPGAVVKRSLPTPPPAVEGVRKILEAEQQVCIWLRV